MRREFYLILIILLLLLIYIFIPTKEEIKEIEVKEKRAVFVSYIELGNYLRGGDVKEIKENINTIVNNASDFGFNMLILQVRSFSDAIYPSSVFPSSKTVVNKEGDELPFDILDYFIKICHSKNIELHAWINPYRISNDTNTSNISANNPAYKLLNTDSIQIIDKVGIYYNPASSEVLDLILEGVTEIIKNYDVDGIHFDDYFYPKSDNIDSNQYNKAIKTDPNLSLQDFRLDVISSLIKETYDLIKKYDKTILFGISPDGNIDNNYNSNYVDTRLFCTKDGYLDYIMPQVYYGFLNSVKPFEETVKSWNQLITNDIELIPALAFYKTGNVDHYAKEGSNEWILYNNIIAREVLFSRKLSRYNGFAIFRYDSLFNENLTETSFIEKENLKNIL